MANTLASTMLHTAQCLKGIRHSLTTGGGSVTTLVDALMNEPDDHFNGGTIFFLSGTLAGKTAVVTDYDNTTKTFTFTTQTAAPGSGIRYAVMDATYSREDLSSAVNRALSELSPIPVVLDDAAFVTVADQEKYQLPTGVSNVRKVFIAANDAEPYGWVENRDWFENEGYLYFDVIAPSVADKQIRLYYEGAHTALTTDAGVVSGALHPDLVAWTAAYLASLIRSGLAENSEPHTKEIVGLALQQANRFRAMYPVRHFRKTARMSGWQD